ncbi:hypothetical protein QR680_016267 [Steinernema hermaphroditum]|uniref:Uncharacterized protein n=1 Tax=Steinernema hermaphroditum TaxID=289476 RepID=A0AA39HBL1_9BILA|nr:hypothetical protein QR680_016267 [Steinernema hermaphroditum]
MNFPDIKKAFCRRRSDLPICGSLQTTTASAVIGVVFLILGLANLAVSCGIIVKHHEPPGNAFFSSSACIFMGILALFGIHQKRADCLLLLLISWAIGMFPLVLFLFLESVRRLVPEVLMRENQNTALLLVLFGLIYVATLNVYFMNVIYKCIKQFKAEEKEIGEKV